MEVGDEAEFIADIVGFEKYKNQYGKITDLGSGNGIVKWIPHDTALRSNVGAWDVGVTTIRIHTFQVGEEVEFINSHHFSFDGGKTTKDLIGCHGKITSIDAPAPGITSRFKWLPNDPAFRSQGTGSGGWGSDARQLKLVLPKINHQTVVPVASEIRITSSWTSRNADGRTPKDEELFQAMLKRRAAKLK